MKHIVTGQVLLIMCCMVYTIWWYRGFRPKKHVSRVGGINGVLLMVTVVLGIAGIIFSLIPENRNLADRSVQIPQKMNTMHIIFAGIVGYLILLLVTQYFLKREVTTELILIVGWITLEVAVINRLNAEGFLPDNRFFGMCIVLAIAFVISIILYVMYYRMDDTKAFYSAMIPLITEAVSMGVLIAMIV